MSESLIEKISKKIDEGKNRIVGMLKTEMEKLKKEAKLREKRWEKRRRK